MGREISFISTGRTYALIALALTLCAVGPAMAAAQGTLAATTSTAPKSSARPSWSALTVEQQQTLAPLAADWDSLDSAHKKKWLAIGNKFPSMKPEERNRIQNRMREWVALSPQQRHIARENYWRAKKIKANQKSARWQEYQELPDDLKKSLAAAGASNNRVANLPKARKSNDATPAKPKKIPIQPDQTQDKNSSILTPSVPPDTK